MTKNEDTATPSGVGSTVELEGKLLNGMLRILGGINMTETESENGWWETSTGAKFGSDKLLELIKFMSITVRSNTI